MSDDNKSYDENDIQDFEDYLQYYGFDGDEEIKEDEDEIETDIKELFF